MVAAAAEKKVNGKKRKVAMGKVTEEELLPFLFTTDSKIFAQTVHLQIKKPIISQLS